jgi:hypothetical protein
MSPDVMQAAIDYLVTKIVSEWSDAHDQPEGDVREMSPS